MHQLQYFPEVSGLLEVRAPSKSIRYWLNRRNAVAVESDAVARLFLPYLSGEAHGLKPTDINVLGYDAASHSALLHIRNTDTCLLCSLDTITGAFTREPVPLADMLGYIGSREFLRSVKRSIDVVGRARKWLRRERS